MIEDSVTPGWPAGYIVRSATIEDVIVVLHIRNTSNAFDYGSGSMVEAELLAEWKLPRLDLEAGTWVVTASNGQTVGYGEAALSGGGARVTPQVWLLPLHRGLGIEDHLLWQAEQYASGRSEKAAGECGSITQLNLIGRASSRNEAAQRAYEQAGYSRSLSFQVMQIDLEEMPREQAWPMGIEVRPFTAERDEQATYAADEEASEDKGYHTPMSFEEWFQRMDMHSSDFNPKLWFLAWDGDELAGVALNYYDASSGEGWVDHLGVRRAWRKRGLGMALLLHSFGEFYRLGTQTVKLSVDSSSLTNAPRLYSDAGMRIVQLYHIYRKTV